MKKRKLKRICLGVLLYLLTVCAIGVGSYGYFRSKYIRDLKAEDEVKDPEKLVIYTPEASHSGTLTILYPDDSIQFQYQGEIQILNDGEDGKEIDIAIQIPETKTVHTPTVVKAAK